jgi:hypothetical protein
MRKKVVADAKVARPTAAGDRLRLARAYKTELLGLYLSYELFRNFKARWFGKIDAALFARITFKESIALRERLRRPTAFDDVFESLMIARID